MHAKWSAVDEYLVNTLLPADPALDNLLLHNQQSSLPPIDVAPNQGQLLALLVQISGAHKVLEIGTLGGYSTVWMARALPEGGSVVTLEADAHHARVAQDNIRSAGLNNVEIRVGPAADTLPGLAALAPFDLIFIDADKPNNPLYLEWALKYSRSGTLIIGDNVVRDGEVTNPESPDERVQGVRKFIEMLGHDSRLTVTALQTVGSKGWDGFTLARVK